MWDALIDLLGSRQWEPHGHCFLWSPPLLWTIVLSNLLIGVAYFSIPLTLLTLVRKRQDLLHRNVFILFAVFIFSCGATHLIKLWTIWEPVYWLQGVADALTAGASVVTAVLLWPLLPRMLAIPSSQELESANAALAATNRQLQRALDDRRRQAEELSRSNADLERFAYVASHDLRAPLRAIDNLATWLAEDEAAVLSEQGQRYLRKIQGRARRLETMVEDLLEYSRAGRVRHEVSLVDTAALVHEAAAALALPEGFTVTAGASLPLLTTERTPLATVLRNLIGNAAKHHDRPGEGEVTVAALEHAEWVEFVVTDNGPGIEPQFQARVFQIFQTLKPRDEVEGSGMGLAVVQRIVESRGGRIWVESSHGQGAAFHFTWPRSP